MNHKKATEGRLHHSTRHPPSSQTAPATQSGIEQPSIDWMWNRAANSRTAMLPPMSSNPGQRRWSDHPGNCLRRAQRRYAANGATRNPCE